MRVSVIVFCQVSFKDPIAESYHKANLDENKNQHCSSILPRAGKLSYEEWGRSFGIPKADSSVNIIFTTLFTIQALTFFIFVSWSLRKWRKN